MRDPARILVVDDVPDNVDILQMRLESQGYEVVTAGDGVEALEKIRELLPDLVLLMRGFTGFSETAEPEDVMAVLREYHNALGPLIHRYEGTLDRFTGDGMLVVFNDPVPCPDAALRAVRLAVDMREVVAALARSWAGRGHEIGFGVGIAQGYATLGRIGFEGRFDYTAIGTVTNLAARLCAEAKDGQILVTQRVSAAIDKIAELQHLGDIAFKGLSRPITVLNVSG